MKIGTAVTIIYFKKRNFKYSNITTTSSILIRITRIYRSYIRMTVDRFK